MSQQSRTCPSCGTPLVAGQRFCSNCGADVMASQVASQYSVPSQQVPPYAQASYGQQPPTQQNNPLAEILGALGLLFLLRRYRPGYSPRRQSSGCCGCLIALLIVAMLFGVPSYIYYSSHGSNIMQRIEQGTSNSTLPTKQPAITTAQINQTVTYSGVDITIVNAQQSTAFIDDDSTVTNGMLRLNIQEKAGQKIGSYNPLTNARLMLPDKSLIAPVGEKDNSSLQSATTRSNWLDFPVASSIKVAQVTLVLGTDQEAQIILPLTGNADLQAYQPKIVNLNASTQYAGLTWTVTTAAQALSADGQQATKGMVFVTITMKIDNSTSNTFSAYWGDYIRLKAGSTMSAPSTDSNFPLSVDPGTTGTTGTLLFSVPQGSNGYTLILLAKPDTSPPISQAIINFQL